MTEGAGEGDLGDYMVFRGEWRGGVTRRLNSLKGELAKEN